MEGSIHHNDTMMAQEPSVTEALEHFSCVHHFNIFNPRVQMQRDYSLFDFQQKFFATSLITLLMPSDHMVS